MSARKFNPKYLALLGVAGVTFIAFDAVFPGSGLALALGVAFFFFIDTGAADFVLTGVNRLRRGVTG